MYCERCLLELSNGEERWHCPDCRKLHICTVNSLTRNYHLEKLVEKFKKDLLKSKSRNREIEKTAACKKHDRTIEYRK